MWKPCIILLSIVSVFIVGCSSSEAPSSTSIEETIEASVDATVEAATGQASDDLAGALTAKVVLRVEDLEYTLSHLTRRMRLELDTGFSFSLGTPSILNLPDFVLSQLEGEALLLQGIGDLDIEITDQDIGVEVALRGDLSEETTDAVIETELLRQATASGLELGEYELMLGAFLAEQRAHDHFLQVGPLAEPQVRGRMLIVDDEEEAESALARMDAGEDFIVVAREVTLAPSAVEIEWFVRDGEPTVFENVQDFFFDADIGERSAVISQRDFFYIVEVLEKDDARTLDDDQREAVADRQLAEWISGLRASLSIERILTQDDGIRALNEIS